MRRWRETLDRWRETLVRTMSVLRLPSHEVRVNDPRTAEEKALAKSAYLSAPPRLRDL